MSRCAIAAWANRTWAFDSANVLPPLRPRARAAVSPARVRSRIQLPLEHGQRREDAEYEAAGGGGGVDLRALPGGCFRHQLLLPRPYLVLTKPLRLDVQCQRAASVKIGWKYLDD